jgi:hypothetical protein
VLFTHATNPLLNFQKTVELSILFIFKNLKNYGHLNPNILGIKALFLLEMHRLLKNSANTPKKGVNVFMAFILAIFAFRCCFLPHKAYIFSFSLDC